LEVLEDRSLPSVTIAATNNSGNGYVGLTIDQANSNGGGFVPPDTNGAAGPSEYIQSANLVYGIFTPKATGTTSVLRGIVDFFTNTSTGGGLTAVTGGSWSDPAVVYDEYIGKFVLQVMDTGGTGNASASFIAVSTSNNPATLTNTDWKFYKETTTETGSFFLDYPGNIGYNNTALVITYNQFLGNFIDHVLVESFSQADLSAGSATPKVTLADFSGQSLRPSTMHNDTGTGTTDTMWLVEEATAGAGGSAINVVAMNNILTTPTFTTTSLAVTSYSEVKAPLQPGGTSITTNIDSRIQKASYNVVSGVDTLVAAHAVSNTAGDRDKVQWYRITISGGVPSLADQGDVDSGANTYDVYPAIDIGPDGTIGMGYTRSGTDTSTDFMSGYITGRLTTDTAGTMETPVLIPKGTGSAVDTLDGREGDLSGINIDPSDGSFWVSQEFETFSNAFATGSWGEAIANFTLGATSTGSADLSLTESGPATANEGDSNLTYTFTVTNNGPDSATSPVLTDTIGTNLKFVSATTTSGTFTQSGSTVTFNMNTLANLATATATVTLQATEDGSVTNSGSVTSGTSDPNPNNNSASVSTTVAEPAIVVSAPIRVSTKKLTNFAVATFTHASGVEATSAFTATIAWGDGSSTTGTITESGTTYTVKGTHTYSKSATHTITTTVKESGTSPTVSVRRIQITDDLIRLIPIVGRTPDGTPETASSQDGSAPQNAIPSLGFLAASIGTSPQVQAGPGSNSPAVLVGANTSVPVGPAGSDTSALNIGGSMAAVGGLAPSDEELPYLSWSGSLTDL
jgi:uncharacterized repeat protein (TIGR01451 family)